MGISFDLTVEDLPANIFDRVVEGNYHKIDPFTISRWDGIDPIRESWIVNDIQVANNIVIVCGSYTAFFDVSQTNPDVGANALYEALVVQTLQWRDGFFAACNFDYLDKPEAWHLVPCRAALEFGPYMAQEPINQNEGGLYSMCVDGRTIGQERSESWFQTFGQGNLPGDQTEGFRGEDVFVTVVGYHAVDGMDLNDYDNAAPPFVANPQQYDPYHYSLFDNQDFYPCIYTFVVTPFLDPTDPADLAKRRQIESQPTPDEPGDPFTIISKYVARLTGQDGVPIDQLGRATHLNLINDTGSPDVLFNEQTDYALKVGRSYGVCVAPLEQYSYRCHTMGVLNTPVTNRSWFDPYARAYSRLGYVPTSFMGQFPIMKPLEFAIGVPGTQVRTSDLEAEYLFTPESVRNTEGFDVTESQVRVHSDALLWRHGFIPRKFKTVFRSQPISSPLIASDPTFPDNVIVPSDAYLLGTLVIGGDCLVQEYDALRNRPVSGMAKTSGGNLVYEPLLVYGMNGYTQFILDGSGGETNQNLGFGFFMGYTKRNMTVSEDDSGAGVSSLDNASIEWVAPTQMTVPGLGATTSFLLGFQITSPSERGEVYAFQPALVNSQNYPQRFCQDWKVIGPYLTAAQDNLPTKIPVRWHNIASQPILDLGPAPSPTNGLSYFNNYKRYGLQTPEATGDPVGRSIIMGGNESDGTYAVAYDYGAAFIDFNPVWNSRTFAPTDPETAAFDGFMQLKFSGLRSSNGGYTDSLTNSGPGEIKFATNDKKTGDEPRYGTQLYHIPNDNMQYPNNVNFPVGGWEWLQASNLSLNGFDITAANAGATIAPPTGLYESLDQLVQQLNQALDYQKSAGAPFDQNTPNGLGGITFKKTSDNKGVYSQVDNQFLDTDPTIYAGYLGIVDPLAGGFGAWNTADNYPYGNDLPGGAIPYFYEWFGAGVGGAGEPGAVTCEPLEVLTSAGCFLNIGPTIDDTIVDPVTDGSKRFFLSGDYDTDRDQWLLSISNIGANADDGKYYVVAATTDYSEFLEQTDNFPLNSGNALLLALNQRTFKLDGAAFSGTFRGPLNSAGEDNPVHGVTTNSTMLGSALYGYKISGTTGRDVKVFLNYMLYDGLDSLIAVEVANLGLRVTPENVLWYKTNILNQNADEEVTLEEIQNWMAMQREQYEELLRNRKPVTRDQGSLPNVKDFVLDDESIEDLLPELTRLPPNPDSDPSDADMMGNTLSGDIQSVDEKRRETDV